MTRTLAEALSDEGISWKSLKPGSTDDHLTCPRCHGGPKGDGHFSLKIDFDGLGAVWQCWRKNHCGWTDGLRVDGWERDPAPAKQEIRRIAPKPSADKNNRPDWLYQYFSERKIGARTVDHFGIHVTTRWFRNGEDQPAIVFPFIHGGNLVNRKYRTRDKQQSQDKNATPTLFNVDALGTAPEEIVFVEGEPDVMAMFESGIPHAVTLPIGAPMGQEKSERRYEALRTHEALLTAAKRIVLAGDMDKPGVALRDELARRLGKHRCFIVTWPDGCKDAGDVLRQHGPAVVVDAVRKAEGYPIQGIYRMNEGALREYRSTPQTPTMTTGVWDTNDVLKFPTEGRLIVITGIPAHGKTSYARFVAVHTAHEHNRHWAIFTPEHMPQEEYLAELAEVYSERQFYSMSENEIDKAERFIRDKITMIVADPEREPTTLDWLLNMAKAAILRYGTTDLMIDPWNELEHNRGDLSETDYTGRALQRLKAFALSYSCNVWVIAHPMKPPPVRNGEKITVPGLYTISGSSNWANKCDLGLTVFAPDDAPGMAQIHVMKSRFKRWASKGAVAKLTFNQATGCYSSPNQDLVDEVRSYGGSRE